MNDLDFIKSELENIKDFAREHTKDDEYRFQQNEDRAKEREERFDVQLSEIKEALKELQGGITTVAKQQEDWMKVWNALGTTKKLIVQFVIGGAMFLTALVAGGVALKTIIGWLGFNR